MIGLRKIRRYWYQWTRHSIGCVWMLHRVTDEVSDLESQRRYEITPAKLEQLIQSYKERGYEFISIAEVEKRMSGGESKGKFIALTLDDGYEDTYSVAFPIFEKYNVPFCVYVAEGPIIGEVCPEQLMGYMMLSEMQIFELSRSPLCTIGSHTKSHVALEILSEQEQYAEIKHCNEWLEGVIGHLVVDFAYPYGRPNKVTFDIVKDLGIERAVLAGGGDVLNNTGRLRLAIPRIVVTNETE